ncbi:MAG: amylo-alpha-1,6-glucosidase [Steroidobacteraceae bacterium]
MNARPREFDATQPRSAAGRAEQDTAAVRLDRDALGNFASVSAREWLVTNGLGGYASGSVGGTNTRRYHGFLVAALRPPLARTVMVSKVDAMAHYRGLRVPLATNEYGDGTVDPHGYRQLQSFRLEGQVPVWTWLVGDALLEQRVWMAYGENTSYMQWRLLRSTAPMQLELHPLCTWRDYHWHHRGRREPQLALDDNSVEVVAFNGAAPYRLSIDAGRCEANLDWYWNFHHREEQARGLDTAEDLFRPAVFQLQLAPGTHATLIATSETHAPLHADDSLERQREREHSLLRAAARASHLIRCDEFPEARQLVLAADQFLVARHLPDGRPEGRTVIAGYPWFGDWGRDTMIALPGLTLITGREDEASQVLRTFARHVSQGMLPNRFPDDGEVPEYNTVDATLWFFIAIHLHLERTKDAALRRELLPVLDDIIEWHCRGTRYGISMDPSDSLLRAGTDGVQLTWMDARIGDWVVTPRTGKAVEINALWINALRILASMHDAEQHPEAARRMTALAELATQSFRRRFWNESTGYLNDVIDTPSGLVDSSLRPNQIFALSLPYSLLEAEQARAVIDVCLRSLWTPVGMRSLNPRHHAFTGRYAGSPQERDAVYHQGTVWSWLLGPFALAHYRVHKDRPAALALLSGLLPHLREACVGQISEIFDGDAPFAPAGCTAQAWSVAETLRAWSDINECQPASF